MLDLEIEFGKMKVAEINNLFLRELSEGLTEYFGFEDQNNKEE